jgi:hypothetical protein
VNRLVPLLREQGVQAIVVLLHEGGRQAGGYDGCDGIAGPVIEVVKRTDPEVDVFVTGHTHRAYVCEIDGRLVTSAGSYGRILTDIDLAIDPATGDIVSAEAANEIVTHDVARHPRLSSLVARYRRLAAPLEKRVVGSLAATVDRSDNEVGESALGDLVADAQAAATGADVAFVHADGIRADLEAGDVTYGEAFAVQPFGHRLVTMTLTGAEIDAVLEEQWLGQPFPRLLAASAGLRYSRDPEAAPGRRVEFATTTLAGRPLRPERRYRVTVNEFLADGGNDFATFATGTDRELGPTDVDALARLLRRGVSGYTEPEGRVTRRSAGATVVAVGDIASCLQTGDEATAEVVREIDPDAVLTLGDNVYPSGTPEEFAECYDPSWGRFLDRTHPAPGNHDYATPEAAGYFGYFGSRAPGPYYSFDLGDWHLVSLNTEINRNWDSPQLRWLRRDLRTDDHRCELLYWHRARWSGGSHGSSEYSQPLWRAAYEAGVDLVLVGHDHNYQRFPRLDARGRPDPSFGVVQIVAGTGGRGHYDAGEIAHRVVADEATFGVLKLRLGPRGYSLRFVPVAGGSFSDVVRGGRCHGAPPRG